jgi:RHS repeat-associated protein
MASFPISSANALRSYVQRYRYDPAGNLVQLRHSAGPLGSWTRDYAYAADSNRLERTWEGGNTVAATRYVYDSHGNVLNLANVAPTQRLRWDYRDMIRQVNLLGGGWAYYNYDSGKQRTRKRLERQGGTVEERLYLGGYERYRRYNAQQRVVEEIESHHLFEGDERVLLLDDVVKTDHPRMPVGPLYRHQYGNHLGSAVVELDDQARIISYEEYHPYGTSAYRALTNRVDVPPKRYRYTGKDRDDESGLYYHGARHYAPWLGRWTSYDPAGMAAGTNLYRYGADNPIRFIDPTGHQEQGFGSAFASKAQELWGIWSQLDAGREAAVAQTLIETKDLALKLAGTPQIFTAWIMADQVLGTIQREGGLGLAKIAFAPFIEAFTTGRDAYRDLTGGNYFGVGYHTTNTYKHLIEIDLTLGMAGLSRDLVIGATEAGISAVDLGPDLSKGLEGAITSYAAETGGLSLKAPAEAAPVASLIIEDAEMAAQAQVFEAPAKPPPALSGGRNPLVPAPLPGESPPKYGMRIHADYPQMMAEEVPGAKGQMASGRGQRGPDFVPSEGLNVDYSDLKSIFESESKWEIQARKWGRDIRKGAYTLYDRSIGYLSPTGRVQPEWSGRGVHKLILGK